MARNVKKLIAREKKLENSPKKSAKEFALEKKISKLKGKKYIGKR